MGLTPGINSPKGLGKNHLINGVGVTVGRDEFVDMEWPSVRATSKTDHIILSQKLPYKQITVKPVLSRHCIKLTKSFKQKVARGDKFISIYLL